MAMLQSSLKLLLEIPETAPLLEPILQPRRGDRPWRIAELEALSDDEASYELVRGDLYAMTPASPKHGIYATRLAAALLAFVDEQDLGIVVTSEPGFILQQEPLATVRAPDVAFIRKERIPPADLQEGFWALAPDLVVEIISPSESANAIQEKVNDYLQAGTRLIWLVYPRLHNVVEYRSLQQIRQIGPDGELEGGDLLPGFVLPLTTLFRQKTRLKSPLGACVPCMARRPPTCVGRSIGRQDLGEDVCWTSQCFAPTQEIIHKKPQCEKNLRTVVR